MHENTNVFAAPNMTFDILGMQNQPTSQQQKDFRKLEASIIKMCTKQCLRREMHYESHTEFCMAKCYDLSYIYVRTGIAELTEFVVENQIKT